MNELLKVRRWDGRDGWQGEWCSAFLRLVRRVLWGRR